MLLFHLSLFIYFQFCLLVTAVAFASGDDSPDGGNMPFDFFLGPQQEELTRERPLAFNPDEGHDFRRQYEDKYGYRGERLIATLGGGSAPLSIFDASLLDKQEKQTTTAAPELSSTEGASPSDEGVTSPPSNSTGVEEEENQDGTKDKPLERKYVEIDRKHNGFLTESYLQNNIPQEESFNVSPDGVVYKRLYSAIWNYGAKGLPNRAIFDGSTQGRSLFGGSAPESRATFDGSSATNKVTFDGNSPTDKASFDDGAHKSAFDAATGGKGLDGALTSNLAFGGGFPRFGLGFGGLDSFYTPNWSGLNFNQEVPTVRKEQFAEEEVNKPSQQEFAGLGEPSILVQSYSYRWSHQPWSVLGR